MVSSNLDNSKHDFLTSDLGHFKNGHERLETYVQSLNEVMANLELGAETLVTQSDEFVCRQSMKNWGFPCSSFSYGPDVHLALPINYKKVMLTEQLPACEMWIHLPETEISINIFFSMELLWFPVFTGFSMKKI